MPQALKCDVVLVVGDERLYSQLSMELKRAAPTVQVGCPGLWVVGGTLLMLSLPLPLLPSLLLLLLLLLSGAVRRRHCWACAPGCLL